MALPVVLVLALSLLCSSGTSALVSPIPGECTSPPSTYQLYSAPFQVSSSALSGNQLYYAQGFTVAYYNNYKVVNNTFLGDVFALYQCGTTAPVPGTTAGVPADAKVFSVPLRAVSVDDTSILGFMKELDLYGRVHSATEFVIDSCMQSLVGGTCNRVSPDFSLGDNPNVTEKAPFTAEAANVDAFMTYAKRTNPTIVSVSAPLEVNNLGQAEWVKYIATFFNKELEANALYNQVLAMYQKLKASSAAAAATKVRKPRVAWLYYSPEYSFPAFPQYNTPESVKIYFTPFRMQYVTDAGGQPLSLASINATYNGVDAFASGDDFLLTNKTTWPALLKAILNDTDVVIDESAHPGVPNAQVNFAAFQSLFGFTPSNTPNFKFLANQRIYRLDGIVNPNTDPEGLDWFQSRFARPDVMLTDMVLALNPEGAPAGAQSTILRSLFDANRVKLVTGAQCPLSNCRLPLSTICPPAYQSCNGTFIAATAAQRCAPSPLCGGAPPPPPSAASCAAMHPALIAMLAGAALVAAVLTLLA